MFWDRTWASHEAERVPPRVGAGGGGEEAVSTLDWLRGHREVPGESRAVSHANRPLRQDNVRHVSSLYADD